MEGRPADLVLDDCRIVNVITKEILPGDIAIRDGFIVGVGDVSELVDRSTVVHSLKGRWVCPGLIDGHLHFESSMVTLSTLAGSSLSHGTTGIVIDPHEIANILGKRGVEMVLEEAGGLDMDVFVMVPSCVPPTELETGGARLELEDVRDLLGHRYVLGLGEVMDYLGVLRGGKLDMIEETLRRGLRVDGHCPGLRGAELFRYMAAGISSDHEALSFEEVLEKARLGMAVMLREGSAASSLEEFIPPLLESGVSLENFFLVSDDRNPRDMRLGHMDLLVRKAISLGVEPVWAVALASFNTARHYRVDHLVGSISTGRRANLVVLDDLESFKIYRVYARGKPPQTRGRSYPSFVLRTLKYRRIHPGDLWIPSDRGRRVRVIGLKPGSLYTRSLEFELDSQGEHLQPDLERDVLPLAVVERHGKNHVGLGFVHGFRLKRGAIGQSIAHDTHNVILVGTDYREMAECANRLLEIQGGIVVSNGGSVWELPLPFAGILSLESLESVEEKLEALQARARELGCPFETPFAVLSFLALPVIPELKLTDRGLVDVERKRIISVCL